MHHGTYHKLPKEQSLESSPEGSSHSCDLNKINSQVLITRYEGQEKSSWCIQTGERIKACQAIIEHSKSNISVLMIYLLICLKKSRETNIKK